MTRIFKKIKENNGYKRTAEKSHSQLEIREYYQWDKINWMQEKSCWKGIKSIGMVRKTIIKDSKETIEKRYYISSLPLNINILSKAIRQHWSVEIMHWYLLDVTFKEDTSISLDKTVAQNLNIINK